MSNMTKTKFKELCQNYVMAHMEESENLNTLKNEIKDNAEQFDLDSTEIINTLNDYADSGAYFDE